MTKIFTGILFFISGTALADSIVLQPGSSIQVSAGSSTTVSCSGTTAAQPTILNCYCSGDSMYATILDANGVSRTIEIGAYYSDHWTCVSAITKNPRCSL